MRLPASMIMCVVLAAAAPALAASQTAYVDCKADDPERNIAGCTLIIEDRGESERNRAIACVGRGQAWRAKGDLARAIADFTGAIGLGQDYRAIADFTDVIRLDPNNADAYYARGVAWSTNGDRDRAIGDLSEAVQLRPYSPGMIAALKQLKPDTPDHTVITPDSLKRFLETH